MKKLVFLLLLLLHADMTLASSSLLCRSKETGETLNLEFFENESKVVIFKEKMSCYSDIFDDDPWNHPAYIPDPPCSSEVEIKFLGERGDCYRCHHEASYELKDQNGEKALLGVSVWRTTIVTLTYKGETNSYQCSYY